MLRVLIVEDDSIDAKRLQCYLDKSEHVVHIDVADTGGLTRQYLSEHHYDVCLLDHRLPDSNSLELLRHIVAEYPHIAVLILTGAQDDRVAIAALKLGACDYLLKDDITSAESIEKPLLAAYKSRHVIADDTDAAAPAEKKTLSLLLIEPDKRRAYFYQHELLRGECAFDIEWVVDLPRAKAQLAKRSYDCVILNAACVSSETFFDQIPACNARTPMIVVAETQADMLQINCDVRSGLYDILQTADLHPGTLVQRVMDMVTTSSTHGQANALPENLLVFYQNLVESMEEGALAFSADGVITFANRQIGALLGYNAPHLLVGRNIETLVRSEEGNGGLLCLGDEHASQKPITREMHLMHRQGYPVSVLVNQAPLQDPDSSSESISYSWVIVDLTQIKKTEQQLQEKVWALDKANQELRKVDRMKSNFLSMVSHELRTPLASIKEGVALVLDSVAGPINEKQKNFLTIVKRNIDRFNQLIDHLLDLSKIEQGKVELQKQAVDMNAVVHVGSHRVLVVDDEADLRSTLQARLEACNYGVKTVENGDDALLAMESYKPDVVLLDLIMPGMNGFEFCRELRKQKEYDNIPVVILTCLEDAESARKLLEIGASGYLVKPFEPESLVLTLSQLLGGPTHITKPFD